MNEKYSYFPRKKIFEETQHLVASFFSTGEYHSDYDDITKSLLSKEENTENQDFFYPLFLLCLSVNLQKTSLTLEKIKKKIKRHKKIELYETSDLSNGDLDIDRYVKDNLIERIKPKVYTVRKRVSTFQLPEYQLTLKILNNLLEITTKSLEQIEYKSNKGIIKKVNEFKFTLRSYSILLKKRFNVSLSNKDTYVRLKLKVNKRYNSRKILNPEYKELIYLYESLISLKGLSQIPLEKVDMEIFNEKFDDRLFEIWLTNKVAMYIKDKISGVLNITPLYKARSENLPAAEISTEKEKYQVWFQNRKRFINYTDIKWAYQEDGKEKFLDAIPDIIVVKVNPNDEPSTEEIIGTPLLIDAKNRSWNVDKDLGRIKGELTQFIYVWDNFRYLFKDEFKAILVSHNPERFMEKEFYHKDFADSVGIKVISIELTEQNLDKIDSSYFDVIDNYIGRNEE